MKTLLASKRVILWSPVEILHHTNTVNLGLAEKKMVKIYTEK